MKKMLVLVAVLALVPAFASAAATCPVGDYNNGKLTSIDSTLNNGKATLKVIAEGSKCKYVPNLAGSNEEWIVDGNTLIQKEFDKTGKVTSEYKATLQGNKYVIHCDSARKVCDAGIDSRNSWEFKFAPNNSDVKSVTYLVYGAKDKANPNSEIIKRHEFTFTK